MTRTEVLYSLCYHDSRNPVAKFTDEEISIHNASIARGNSCNCDNCFNGTSELAEHILRLPTWEDVSNAVEMTRKSYLPYV
jgi:hypothetical protein